MDTRASRGEAPGLPSRSPSIDSEFSRIVVGCPGELASFIRYCAAELGVHVVSCQSALQVVAEACTAGGGLVLLSHQPPELDGPETQGPPLCHLLRGLRCAARVVCIGSAPGAPGAAQCAADLRIDAPRTAAGVAKILAEIRAVTPQRTQSGIRLKRTLEMGKLLIDLDRRRVFVDQAPVELTKGQYDLLVTLVENEGRVVPFDELHRMACGLSAWTGDTRALRQHVSKLVRKLGNPSLTIENVRGVGYALTRAASPVR